MTTYPALLLDANGKPISQGYNALTNANEPIGIVGSASLTVRGRSYQVGASASTTSIPMLSSTGLTIFLTPAQQSQLVGGSIKIVLSGTLCEAQITAVSSSGTLTLDSALPSAPASGTSFVIVPPDQVSLTGSNAISGAVTSIATANTAQQLPSVKASSKITLIGLKANSATVYIGFSNAVSNTSYGVALDPKDSIDLEITNLNLAYIYGNAGDGVSYVAI